MEKSLARLGHIDRLLLHEVAAADVTDELLSCLSGYVDRGDVDHLGVATTNELTAPCLARAPDLFRVAHVAVGPFAAPVELPDTVTIRVGHGVLGPAAAHLERLRSRLASDAALTTRWRDESAGTQWAGPDGLADALLARAATLGLTDVIVATSRPARLAKLHALVSGAEPIADAQLAIIERLAVAR